MPEGGTLDIRTENADLAHEPEEERSELAPGRVRRAPGLRHGRRHGRRARASASSSRSSRRRTRAGHRARPRDRLRHRHAERRPHLRDAASPGRGSTFKVYFPAARGEAARDRPAAAARRVAARGARRSCSSRTRSSCAPLVAEVLESYGYTVLRRGRRDRGARARGARTGRDRRAAHRRRHAADERPRARRPAARRAAGLRLLFMSGYRDGSLRHAARRSRVEFIQKPFTPGALDAKLRELLDSP